MAMFPSDIYSYESEDDSDEGASDHREEERREQTMMNDTWGSKKRNFYGRDKKNDVSKSAVTVIQG